MSFKKDTRLLKLTVKVELSDEEDRLENQKEFCALCQMAVEKLLGEAGPEYHVDKFFDAKEQIGALIFEAQYLNRIWGALTLHGRYLNSAVAIQMQKVGFFEFVFVF